MGPPDRDLQTNGQKSVHENELRTPIFTQDRRTIVNKNSAQITTLRLNHMRATRPSVIPPKNPEDM